MMDDPRFKRFSTDPKFRMVPKKERKVKIDPRFKSMFSDKRFVSKVSVDKRGRPKSFATKENFEKFYELQSSDSDDDEEEKVEEQTQKEKRKPKKVEQSSDEEEVKEKKQTQKGKKKSKAVKKVADQSSDEENESKTGSPSKQKQKEKKKSATKKKTVASPKQETKEGKKSDKKFEKEIESDDESSDSDIDEKIRSKFEREGVDYARGQGALLSDSSSDDSSDDDEEDEEEREAVAFDKWGELDHDAERTEYSTKRLAICNLDWDRVGAQDIFVALNSFCPPGASVKVVHIYTSEFGKQRLAEEDILGPQELRMGPSQEEKEIDLENLDDDGEMDQETIEKIRIYQVNRLKYYYAVAEFTSVDAADKVYQECDGMEYELSATKFDLRFIPDEMEFDEKPKESCNKPPGPEEYKPKLFENTALKHGKVNLTWDETDPNRAFAMKKAFDAASDDEGDDDVKAYLANSSDDEDHQGIALAPFGDDDELGSSENDEDVVNKYKALLGEIRDKEKKSNSGTDMQVSWIPSDVVSEQAKQKELEAMTPWEQYLAKKKEKRRAKKQKSKNNPEKEGAPADDDDKPFSDDDLPEGVDLDDPFFQTLDESKPEKTNKKKKDQRKGKKNNKKEVETSDKTGLSLLMMESDDDKDHFDYKEIVKNESKKSKKKRNKAKRDEERKAEDNFTIDLADDRFSAIFKKAEYNVDPSNPNFKKTKSMQAFIQEKQRRRGDPESSKSDRTDEPAKKKAKTCAEIPVNTSSLDQLVHAVKAKSNRMKIANKK